MYQVMAKQVGLFTCLKLKFNYASTAQQLFVRPTPNVLAKQILVVITKAANCDEHLGIPDLGSFSQLVFDK